MLGLTVNNFYDIWVWRRALVRALRNAEVNVIVVGPPSPWGEKVAKLGCWVPTYPLDRRGLNPLSETRSLLALCRIYRRWKPDLVHHFTIKPNLYGTLAARLAGVPVVIATVTGLGYLWTDAGPRAWILRAAVGPVYRWVLRLADAVIYLNEDDRRILGGKRTVVVPGEGIDLKEFAPEAVPPGRRAALRAELGLAEDAPVALMVGRMLRHKGVVEFVEAARLVRRTFPQAVFLLVGPSDEGNPARIPPAQLKAWETEGTVRYLGVRDDIRDLMAIADIVVLPSYREGMPRVLVEGAAMGKPLVATDVPGCRDVVQHQVNGFLVSARDSVSLASAIRTLLADPALRMRFGQASRSLAEAKFSDRQIVRRILTLYAYLLEARGLPVPPAFRQAGS